MVFSIVMFINLGRHVLKDPSDGWCITAFFVFAIVTPYSFFRLRRNLQKGLCVCVHPGGLFVRAPHHDERNYAWSELNAIGADTISAQWYVSVLDFKAMRLLNKISSVVRPYRTRLEIRRAVEEGLQRYAADPSNPDAPECADSASNS